MTLGLPAHSLLLEKHMGYFLAIGAFVLLIIQSVMLLEFLNGLASPDSTTALSALLIVVINSIGILFNVMTLRHVMSDSYEE